VDLHKDSLTAVVLDKDGRAIERRVLPTKCRQQVAEYFATYGTSAEVAVESVGFYQWFWDLVGPRVGRLYLADAAGVRSCAPRKKAKTDRNDALLLATLLRQERLPMAYVPPEPMRELRDLLRLRHSLARSLAAERRQLRWIGLKNNFPGPRTLTSAAAQKWLLSIEPKLGMPNRLAARHRLDHIVRLEREVQDLEHLLDERLRADPALQRQVDLLCSVPGVGGTTALTVLAETGQITRFDHPDQLGSYAGLAPRVRQSGETVHHGHISKRGPPVLRWVLQQAAWTALRTDAQARRFHNRISRRAGSKKATTALARKLLIYCWSVARRGQPFRWPREADAPSPPVPDAGVLNYEI
jgi:transposase